MAKPKPKAFTRKQERFVAEYLVDLNATQAAIRAGYSQHTAAFIGHENLTKPNIAALISARAATRLEKVDLTAERVLEEISLLARSNTQDLFNQRGNLIPIHKLTREQAACISSLEIIKKNAEAGDGHIDIIHKVRLWDKLKALEMAAKHLRLLEPDAAPRDDLPRLVIVVQSAPGQPATSPHVITLDTQKALPPVTPVTSNGRRR